MNAIRQQSGARGLALFFLASTSLWPSQPAWAACHKFHVWHYPKPQRCFTALAPPRHIPEKLARWETGFTLVKETAPKEERITIPLPHLDDINWGEVGPDELRAIALLRQIMESPSR